MHAAVDVRADDSTSHWHRPLLARGPGGRIRVERGVCKNAMSINSCIYIYIYTDTLIKIVLSNVRT